MDPKDLEGRIVDISHRFDGGFHFWKGFFYRNPVHDPERHGPVGPTPEVFHRDILHRKTWRPKDLLRYISPTYGKPFRMIVQAAPNAQPAGDWRRKEVSGNAPGLLIVSCRALGEKKGRLDPVWLIVGRCIVAVPVIFFLVSYPMGRVPNSAPKYKPFLGRCYEYPKHALNALDASPIPRDTVHGVRPAVGNDTGDMDVEYTISQKQQRLLRPRKLIVLQGDEWNVVAGDTYPGPYIFISYAAGSYKDASAEDRLRQRADSLSAEVGAYWLDSRCRAKAQPELTDDVHRFCDVTRGAHKVYVLLPEYEDMNTMLLMVGFISRDQRSVGHVRNAQSSRLAS